MEQLLERMGWGKSPVLRAFAQAVQNDFFGRSRDILVHDESVEYRAPIIAALAGKWLETRGQGGPLRVLMLAESEALVPGLRENLEKAGIRHVICTSEEDTKGQAQDLETAPFVCMRTALFMTAVQEPSFRPREFGLLIMEGADMFGELPSELQRRMWGYLLPPWERRAALFAMRLGARTKNTALDFADNPVTVVLKKAQASLSAIPSAFYRIASDAKFRLLLGRLREDNASQAVVFCNLRQTSKEVEARLRLNHIPAQHVSAAAPAEKNAVLFERFRKGSEPLVLVVSNDNLEVLPSEMARYAIHYDIPLDADVYLERVRVLFLEQARMVGLVCERYEVGLSAIESRFGIRLPVQEIEEGMLAAEDLSAGVSLEVDARRSEPEGPRTSGSAKAFGPRRQAGLPRAAGSHKPAELRKAERKTERKTRVSPRSSAGTRSESPAMDAESLYRMSSEERLAYFRSKYRKLLKSPPSTSATEHASPAGSGEKRHPAPDRGGSQEARKAPSSRNASSRKEASIQDIQDQGTRNQELQNQELQNQASRNQDPQNQELQNQELQNQASRNEGILKRLIGRIFSSDDAEQ